MKKISSVLIVCFLFALSVQTFGQRIGFQAGVNIAKMSMKDDEDNYTDLVDPIMGFNAGVNFEIPFGDLLSVEAALIAETKGYNIKEFYFGELKANALFVDLPILVKVGPSFGPIKVFGAAGPYIGMGIAGKYKAGGESEDITWGSGDDADSKRMDFGAKFGAGAEFSGFNLGIYYSLGLANMAVDTEGGYKESTRTLSISLGYKFGGK